MGTDCMCVCACAQERMWAWIVCVCVRTCVHVPGRGCGHSVCVHMCPGEDAGTDSVCVCCVCVCVCDAGPGSGPSSAASWLQDSQQSMLPFGVSVSPIFRKEQWHVTHSCRGDHMRGCTKSILYTVKCCTAFYHPVARNMGNRAREKGAESCPSP